MTALGSRTAAGLVGATCVCGHPERAHITPVNLSQFAVRVRPTDGPCLADFGVGICPCERFEEAR